MYKASYKDIKNLIDKTEWEKNIFGKDEQVNGYQIAYFSPSSANWAYRIEIVKRNNRFYEVITVFGGVKGYRYINL